MTGSGGTPGGTAAGAAVGNPAPTTSAPASAATAPAAAATAAEEVAGLDRVLTRLALTDDDKLEKVLQKLIPAVVDQLKSLHEATRKKVLEILSHVNKRLKSLPTMQLPLGELVAMYAGEPPPGTTAATYGMVRNFALVYSEMAAERAAGPERIAALPSLLSGLSRRPPPHQAILLRVASASLEHHPQPPVGGNYIPGMHASTTNTTGATSSQSPKSGGRAAAPPAAESEGGEGAAGAAGGAATTEGAEGGSGEGTPRVEMSAAEAALRAKYPFLADPADRDVFLSYALKLLLYSPRTSRGPTTPLAAGQGPAGGAAGAAGAGAAAAAAPPPPPSPGLTVADVRQLEEKGAPSQEQVTRRKLGLLHLFAAAGGVGGPLLPATVILPHLLVAGVDPQEPVARRAEELLKRSASLDPNRPAADLDSEDLIRRLLTLFHGGAVRLFYDSTNQYQQQQQQGAAGAGAVAAVGAGAGDAVATPVGPVLRSKLVTVFCRSITFANTFPASLLTIQECVRPPQTGTAAVATAAAAAGGGGGGGGGGSLSGVYARLRQQGLELCVWVFKHAGRHQLKAMGPVVLQGLLDTLDATSTSPGAPMDSPTLTLRGFAYQAIGSLAQRVPELLRPRTDVARRFFAALADEPPGVRAAVQEATGALSRAFVVSREGAGAGAAAEAPLGLASLPSFGHRSTSPAHGSDSSGPSAAILAYDGLAAELDELLLESVSSHKDAVRLCAVQWACRLFPFDHVPARWICIRASGDNKHDVREAAARGLKPPQQQQQPGQQQGAGGAGPEGAVPGSLPSLYDVLKYVRQRLPRLRLPADPLAPLPLPPRSCLALIALLRACRHVGTNPLTPSAIPTPSSARGPAPAADPMEVDEEVQGGRQVDSDLDLRPEDVASVQSAYACALEAGLCRVEGSSEVTAAALEALVEAAAEDRDEVLARRYAPRSVWLRSFLAHTDPGARMAAAKLLGSHVAGVMEPGVAKDLLGGLCAALAPLIQKGKAGVKPATTGSEAPAAASAAAGAPPLKQEEAEGCLLTVGLILGQAASHPGHPSLDAAAAAAAVSTLTAVLGVEYEKAATAATTSTTSASTATTSNAAVLRATAALALSYACVAGPQPALLQPASQDVTATGTAAEAAAATAGMDVDANNSMGAAPAPLEPAATAALATAEAAAAEPKRILDLAVVQILDLLSDKDAKVVARAATAAGFLAGGWAGAWGAAVPHEDAAATSSSSVSSASGVVGLDPRVSEPLLGGLFALASNKSEDIQFAVGEALAWAFGGLSVASPAQVLSTNFTTLGDALTSSASSAEATTPTDDANGDGYGHGRVSRSGAGGSGAVTPAGARSPPRDHSSPPTARAEGSTDEAAAAAAATLPTVPAAESALRERVLGRLLGELVVSPKAEVRCAGAVWLVSLLGFCGGARELRGPALPRTQQALSGLLGDPNELTQEMASRGVSLVYGLGDAAVREQLVTSLVSVLGGAGPGGGAGRPVKLTADTQVFEEGALGTAPGDQAGGASGGASASASSSSGGGLSTYRELCALATDLGQPDLIYKFMDLAHHAAALNSRRGAAFGFAGIARQAARGGGAPGAALARHLGVLVPKLFRYTHDPNPRVAEAMVAIWRSLVDDPRGTLDKHFGPIMMDLIREMGGRLWRNRQAACSAMGELLQGRRWPELSPYFSQLWVMLFRAMDDIKDSVRRAALSLARTVRGLTLRLVDPALTPARECSAAVSVLLPILLEKGVPSNVAEIRSLSVEVLGLACKSAPASALRPLLPLLVPALLEALSSLEDVRLNYVEQHADRLGLDSERLEGARVAAARASPLGDTLDLAARLADGPSLEALVPALVGTVKRGVGLNTKVGTARFIRNLASRPGALAGGGSGTAAGSSSSEPLLRPHVAPVLRVLIGAVRSERSATVRKAYAAAAAQVVRHGGEKRLDKFVAEALGSYTDPGADTDSRLAGGLLLRELLRAAPEKLRSYDSAVLPVAFGAKMDEDKEVAAVFAEIWEEGVSSEPAALRLYGKEICKILCEMLSGQQWGRKKAAAEAAVKLTQIAPDALGENNRLLVTSLLSELGVGRLWDGKDSLLGALAAVVAADPRVTEAAPGHGAVMEAFMGAVGRKKASYRTAALTGLDVVLRSLPGSHYPRVAPPLLAAVAKHCEAGGSEPSSTTTTATTGATGAGAEEEAEPLLPLSECLTVLGTAFARVGAQSAGEAGEGGSGWPGREAGIAAPEAAAAEGVQAKATVAADELLDSGAGLSSALRGVLTAQLPWQAKLAAAGAAKGLAQRCSSLGLPPAAAASLLGPLAPGLLQSALDHKVQQFRLASLEALSAIATAASSAPAPKSAPPAGPAVAAGLASADENVEMVVGWSEADRQELLPGVVSGLQQLSEADKSAAVAAAALALKATLEPFVRKSATGEAGPAALELVVSEAGLPTVGVSAEPEPKAATDMDTSG